jgi:polyphosphate glucokinase
MTNLKPCLKKSSRGVALGIDIGGSGIKGALVDRASGDLVASRFRVKTPQPATPKAMADSFRQLQKHFAWNGPIGLGFPGIIKSGVIHSAANLDDSWIGINLPDYVEKVTGCPTAAVNDADAAGMAELHYGAARDLEGLVILLTVGTGVGSCMILNGMLSPNSELGHLKYKQMKTIEEHASGRIREREKLSWKSWGTRFGGALRYLEFLFNPDAFIIGGGVAKRFEQFEPWLRIKTPCTPARYKNRAGIIGAAAIAPET